MALSSLPAGTERTTGRSRQVRRWQRFAYGGGPCQPGAEPEMLAPSSSGRWAGRGTGQTPADAGDRATIINSEGSAPRPSPALFNQWPDWKQGVAMMEHTPSPARCARHLSPASGGEEMSGEVGPLKAVSGSCFRKAATCQNSVPRPHEMGERWRREAATVRGVRCRFERSEKPRCRWHRGRHRQVRWTFRRT